MPVLGICVEHAKGHRRVQELLTGGVDVDTAGVRQVGGNQSADEFGIEKEQVLEGCEAHVECDGGFIVICDLILCVEIQINVFGSLHTLLKMDTLLPGGGDGNL